MKKRHKKAQTTRRITLKTSDLGRAKALFYNGRKPVKAESKDQLRLPLEGEMK
jgi:hypothetical protein